MLRGVSPGPAIRPEHVERGLQRLQQHFPLEARIQGAPERVRTVYGQVLDLWITQGRPPSAPAFPAAVLQTLAALDAVTVGPAGVGAYPFSADPTPVRIHDGRRPPVHAMCAIDALAIPSLWASPVLLEARCGGCDAPITLALDPGQPHEHSQGPQVAIPPWTAPAQGACPACQALCPAICFLCQRCADGDAEAYRLHEAQRIALLFFAFQKPLLTATR